MLPIEINKSNYKEYIHNDELYMHDGHVITIEYNRDDSNLKMIIEKYSKEKIQLTFTNLKNIHIDEGENNIIDFKYRILDFYLDETKNDLNFCFLIFNMMTIRIYSESVIIEKI